MVKLTILGEFTDLNTYINQNRYSKFKGAQTKKNETERVWSDCKKQQIPKFTTPVEIAYTFYPKDRRKDEDNLLLAIKFLNDGLKLANVIQSDGANYLHIKSIEVIYGNKPARVEVDIYPIVAVI